MRSIMNFMEKLSKIVNRNNSLLCVGLDLDKEQIPSIFFKESKNPYLDFNKMIINSTKDIVCAYKLNMAFYEVLGKNGYKIIEQTINYIPDDIIIILDGKRNDIGNTAKKYAQSLFGNLNCDAVTVNPYLGFDGVKPFLEYRSKCTFVLCRTSNPSAIDFQDLKTPDGYLFEIVGNKIKEWSSLGCIGAVVGATYYEELKLIRCLLGDEIPLLIPGIGAQGGYIDKTIKYGTNKKGTNAIINSSRGIIYSKNPRETAIRLKDEINKYRNIKE